MKRRPVASRRFRYPLGVRVFLRLWRYTVESDRLDDFRTLYGSEGDWARLFTRAPGYRGTDLMAAVDAADTFVTVDRWDTRDAWNGFLAAHRAAYDRLDARCEGLTLREEDLGDYEVDA